MDRCSFSGVGGVMFHAKEEPMHRATLLHAHGPIGRFAGHLLLLLTLLIGLPSSFAHAGFAQASATSGTPMAGVTRTAGTHAARPAPPYRVSVRPHGRQLARFASRPWGAARWATPRPLGYHARSASRAASDGAAGGKKPSPVGTTFPLAPQPGGTSLPPPFVQGVQPALSGPLGSYNPGPYEMAAGSDRRLWFTEYGGNTIGAVAPSTNIVTTYSLPNAGSNPLGIAAGPDLALWFTEYGRDYIGRITTAGMITEYAIPTAGAQAYGIALGADGNLWFTESGTNKIGRITKLGVVTEYAIPTAASSPEGIAAGLDGNLWFTESAVGKVAHFAPATPGTIAERALGSTTSQPIGITGGPDGKIWFAEYGSGLIGKLTTNGVTLIEYSLPTANSHPVDITVGPDQALWFSEFSAQQLGRISTIGNVFEVTTNPPTNSGPVGVAGGPDGNLWYTDYAAGRVGRLGLGAASGSIPWHPSYTVHPAAGLSVSVDLFDGHDQVRAAGMAVPGRGIAAALGRTWDSTLEQQGVVTPAGEGWVADTLVGMSTPGTLTGAVFYGDAGGASWEFDYLGLPGEPGPTYTTYSTSPGLPWRLTTNGGSTVARYILTNILNGATQTFNAGGALVGQADSYGQGNSLGYAGGLVTSIANGSGRALKVGYDTTSGLLNDVQSPLWQSAGPSKGQHVAYLYGGTGCTGVELCSVTWAQGAADARSVGFGYGGGLLTGITTGRSGQWVAGSNQWVLGYDGQGRVVTITAPAAGSSGQPATRPPSRR